MAEDTNDADKSEDPTQKRLEEALKRGDVVKSQEVNTWFVIAGATLVLMTFSGGIGEGLTTTMRGLIAALAIPFLLLTLAALGGNLIQHQLVWSFEALSPKLSKISPLAGLKRLFSKQALANFAKGLIKLVVVGSVLSALLWPERERLEGLVRSDPVAVLPLTQTLALKLLG